MVTLNPIFRHFAVSEPSVGSHEASTQRMTLLGILSRTALLLFMFTACATFSWIEGGRFQHRDQYANLYLVLVVLSCSISSLVLVWVTVYKQTWSPVTAPVYALMQGFVVGLISVGMDRLYPNIAIQAVGLTVSICFCLLGAYYSGLIRVTESFNKKLAVATSGVFVYYLVIFFLAVVNRSTLFIMTGRTPGIIISIIIVIIAALNLVSNFDFAVQRSTDRFPKYMEWYAALGLVVTLIWLYIETLNLLSRTRESDQQ
jgi:uncharacterized YccA/Bax inhibitor family protein